jgi:uncharacterized membrane protein (UPF0127 family)
VRCIPIVAVLAIACSSTKHDEGATMPPPAPPRPAAATAKVVISAPNGDVPVSVEVVSTEAKIEKGLMYREHLPPDDGMLFLLPVQKDWAFWMHNTLIPLDMLFIRKDLTIAGIVQNAEPQTDTLRKVGEISAYVLEVNGGFCASHGIAANQKVRFERVPGF